MHFIYQLLRHGDGAAEDAQLAIQRIDSGILHSLCLTLQCEVLTQRRIITIPDRRIRTPIAPTMMWPPCLLSIPPCPHEPKSTVRDIPDNPANILGY